MNRDAQPLAANRLLEALDQDDRARLMPHLERVYLERGEIVYECGQSVQHAYFPTNAIVSLQSPLMDGSAGQSAIVGNEGMVGVMLIMGSDRAVNRGVVQNAGYALRLRARALQDEFGRLSSLQRCLLRYIQALLTQMGQNSACNRHHTVYQQLCRWILLSVDRLPTNEMEITHELIAGLLGVRREGVTDAAGKLQAAGLIRYCRGHITVLDRAGLERECCECYGVVKREFDRLLPSLAPPAPQRPPVGPISAPMLVRPAYVGQRTVNRSALRQAPVHLGLPRGAWGQASNTRTAADVTAHDGASRQQAARSLADRGAARPAS